MDRMDRVDRGGVSKSKKNGSKKNSKASRKGGTGKSNTGDDTHSAMKLSIFDKIIQRIKVRKKFFKKFLGNSQMRNGESDRVIETF